MLRPLAALLLTVPLTAAESTVPKDFNQFALAAYKQLAQSGGNLVFSPINIATALSMAMAGARGSTRDEFARCCIARTRPPDTMPAVAKLAAELDKAGNSPGSALAQAQRDLAATRFRSSCPAFANLLTTNYSAAPTLLDFAHDTEGARSKINQWTSDQTKGRITDLFPKGSIAAQERLVLTAAIYFNGKWQTPFSTSNTQSAVFHGETGAAAQETPFMNQTKFFKYAGDPGRADSGVAVRRRFARLRRRSSHGHCGAGEGRSVDDAGESGGVVRAIGEMRRSVSDAEVHATRLVSR